MTTLPISLIINLCAAVKSLLVKPKSCNPSVLRLPFSNSTVNSKVGKTRNVEILHVTTRLALPPFPKLLSFDVTVIMASGGNGSDVKSKKDGNQLVKAGS